MKKYYFLLSIVLALLLNACINNGPLRQQSGETLTGKDAKSGPDVNDLLDALQGSWQNERDSTYTITFSGNSMKHFNGNVLSAESEIEIDDNCQNAICKTEGDSTLLNDGWCFIEKGSSGTQCNLVLNCNKQTLQYRPIDTANALAVFKKKP